MCRLAVWRSMRARGCAVWLIAKMRPSERNEITLSFTRRRRALLLRSMRIAGHTAIDAGDQLPLDLPLRPLRTRSRKPRPSRPEKYT